MPLKQEEHNSSIHVLDGNKIRENRNPRGQTFHRTQKLYKKPA
jgi:hypothetical protein